MAKVTIKGKMTTSGRDLMKSPYTKEELANYEKGLLRYSNTSLTLEEFECEYVVSPGVTKVLRELAKAQKPKSLDEMIELLSSSIMLAVGSSIELLALNGYAVDKLAALKWESTTLNTVWNRLFNSNKTVNCTVNGVQRYVWLEEITRPLITSDVIVNASEMGTLISELRGLLDISTKEKLNDVITSLTGVLTGLESLLKEFLLHNISVVEKRVCCKPGFFQKFWNTICEYKWWIAAYAGAATIVYFGIAAFSIPVAGEIWTMGNAAAATAVETVGVTVGMGVTGAILL